MISFAARPVLSFGRGRTIAKHSGFRDFLWVGSSCWEVVILFHCKSCALSTWKPHYCQAQWFQRFFVGWLIILRKGDLFRCETRAFIRSRPHYCQAQWFQRFFVGWLIILRKGDLFRCETRAFIRSRPHYCQAQWFQRFFVGWLIMLGSSNSLSLQELCFEYVEAALLPSTMVSEVFCGLGHHVGKT